jgi:phage-related protein
VYAVQIGRQIYVLHAFQKKSKHGIKTPRQDVDIIERRYRQALKMEQES